MPSVLSTCCPAPALTEMCPTCEGERCNTCLQPHRSTLGSVLCSCNDRPLYVDPPLYVGVDPPGLYVEAPLYVLRSRTRISPNAAPIAVGIPFAVKVVHICDGSPLGPRWPVGRLVCRLAAPHPHDVSDMEEVD